MTLYLPNSSSVNSVEVLGNSGLIRKVESVSQPAICLHTSPLRSECLDKSARHVFPPRPFKFSSRLIRKKCLIPFGILWEKNKVVPLSSFMTEGY